MENTTRLTLEERIDMFRNVVPIGHKNAISIKELTKICVAKEIVSDGKGARRSTQHLLAAARRESPIITLDFGVFIPLPEDRDFVMHYINREMHRMEEISANLEQPRLFLEAATREEPVG